MIARWTSERLQGDEQSRPSTTCRKHQKGKESALRVQKLATVQVAADSGSSAERAVRLPLMMWTFQASLTKSHSYAPSTQTQGAWTASPRQPALPHRLAVPTRPPSVAGPTQVIRSGILTERYGRPASSSPRPCYSWRSRAVEPMGTQPALLCRSPALSPSTGRVAILQRGPPAPAGPRPPISPFHLLFRSAELGAPTPEGRDQGPHASFANARAKPTESRDCVPGGTSCRGGWREQVRFLW
ncbi:hypothetical protein AK812_SmicGene36803 [Symbiodinium microadriaticum]|uniref:Uncharacterized protein n=1 Tax=Symbiodinium microadriaticum TaxID=2951 RepID=A0A1Q9CI15_SYMMI|nr:hypothetical protein AK812_SmicGene36803 [Symbiodinium microadriaticum]